jgi:thioredoxin 1
MPLALLLAMFLVFAGCSKEKTETESERADLERAKALKTMATPSTDSAGAWTGSGTAAEALPRMIDLGRGKCIPCKKMEPILKELKREYAGRAVIEIVNLDEEPHAGEMLSIRLIPTQIFFDAAGTEVWRHEGFLPRDAIITRFEEMGVEPPGGESPDTEPVGTEPEGTEHTATEPPGD